MPKVTGKRHIEPFWTSEDGRHVIYCGDSSVVLAKIPSFTSFVTDPPYGVDGATGGNAKNGKAKYALEGMWKDTFEYIHATVIPIVKRCIDVADRGAVTPGQKYWRIFPQESGVGCFWTPASTGYTSWGLNCFQPILFYGRDPKAGIGQLPSGILVTEASKIHGHPCPKPIRAWTWLVRKVTLDDEPVLDPFMGSGTTGVACVKTGRRFIGIEINRDYCEIAKHRMELALGNPYELVPLPED